MSRTLFGILGALLAAFPDRAVDAYETLAFENPEEATPKGWLRPTVRAEGIAYVLVAAVGGRAHDRLMDITGVFAALALCFPRRYLETGGRLVYEDADSLAWREEFVTAARVLGAVFLALSVRAYRKRSDADDGEN
jgi:hypothetical protein